MKFLLSKFFIFTLIFSNVQAATAIDVLKNLTRGLEHAYTHQQADNITCYSQEIFSLILTAKTTPVKIYDGSQKTRLVEEIKEKEYGFRLAKNSADVAPIYRALEVVGKAAKDDLNLQHMLQRLLTENKKDKGALPNVLQHRKLAEQAYRKELGFKENSIDKLIDLTYRLEQSYVHKKIDNMALYAQEIFSLIFKAKTTPAKIYYDDHKTQPIQEIFKHNYGFRRAKNAADVSPIYRALETVAHITKSYPLLQQKLQSFLSIKQNHVPATVNITEHQRLAKAFYDQCLQKREVKIDSPLSTLDKLRENFPEQPPVLYAQSPYQGVYPLSKNTVIDEGKIKRNHPWVKSILSLDETTVSQDIAQLKTYFINFKDQKRIQRGKPSLNKDDVSIEFLENCEGNNNFGIYKITKKTNNKTKSYFAKLCATRSEPKVYEGLQETVTSFNKFNAYDNYPRFIKYKGMFTLPLSIINEHFKEAKKKMDEQAEGPLSHKLTEVQVLLLEPATGIQLDKYILQAYKSQTKEQIKVIFNKIGLIIGKFHSVAAKICTDSKGSKFMRGYSHGDLNFVNIFYDPSKEMVIFIDYSSFSNSNVIEIMLDEFLNSNVIAGLKPLIETNPTKEQAFKIKAMYDGLREGVLEAFSDPEKKGMIQKAIDTTNYFKKEKDRLNEFFKKLEVKEISSSR